ncbi:protein O-mannosyl-transferase TMTC2-like [Adelges cooleyi]|uniref:protein O-mannosyl-transferase TMTC2-like n=1 Tax=Adelges cooleyi TaxID=133065 RepID=UPI00217FF80C|nr:protein O-mannosyl-transferase TMTC2-like [Adelges cooleyi]
MSVKKKSTDSCLVKYLQNTTVDYQLLVCCSLAFAVYVNTLNAGFVYDDNRAIIANEDIRSSTSGWGLWWNDFWGTPMGTGNSHGSYRPITVLTYRLNYRFFGLRPMSYHATNVGLHSLATGLLLVTARMIMSKQSAVLSTLLFAVHPVHADAVASVVGRADVLSCVFFLLSFLCYKEYVRTRIHNRTSACGQRTTRKFLVFCVVFALLSMLAKENGISVMAICIGYELVLRLRSIKKTKTEQDKSALKILVTSTAVMVAARLCVMSGAVPTFAASDNPTAKHSDPVVRTLTFLHLPLVSARLLVWPQVLSYDWSMDAVPRVETVADPRNAATVLFYLTLVAVGLKALKRRPVAVAVAIAVASYLPVSNMFFYVGFVVAERVLYIPSAGYCLLVGYSAAVLVKKMNSHYGRIARSAVYVLYAAMILSFAVRTMLRNRDWRNEEALYRSGIQVNPPKSYGNLGSILSSQGRTNEAEIAYRSALKYRSNMADVHYNLGNLLRNSKKYEEAICSYKSAIAFRPTLALAYLSLGDCLAVTGKTAEAEDVLKRCLALDGSTVKDIRSHVKAQKSCVLRLGRMFAEMGKHDEAVAVFESAIDISETSSQIMMLALADSLSALRRDTDAEKYYRQLLRSNPTDVSTFLTYGDLLAKNRSRVSEAEELYKKAHRTAPDDATVRVRYAQFLAVMGRTEESVEQYKAAATLAPGDHEIAVKTATALRMSGRTVESEFYYRRTVQLYPEDAASHSNLGAILHINEKFEEAERSYKSALRLQPNDATTLANLRKLRTVHRHTVK